MSGEAAFIGSRKTRKEEVFVEEKLFMVKLNSESSLYLSLLILDLRLRFLSVVLKFLSALLEFLTKPCFLLLVFKLLWKLVSENLI